MKGEKMGIIDLRYGMLFGFVGFALTLVDMYFATGVLDPRFPAEIGAGFLLEDFLVHIKKEKKEKQISSFLLLCRL